MAEESRKLTLKKKRKFWQAHVKAWSASGMTQAEYCRQNGLSIKSFGYWKRKQKNKATEVTFYPVPANPLKVLNNRNQPYSLRLVVDDRFRIEIGNEFSSATLGRLVQTLGRL